MTERHNAAAIRAEAIESLLIEKGLITSAEVDEVVERYNERIGPLNGARVVARAWRDATFKQALLDDAHGGGRAVRIRRWSNREARRGGEHADGAQRRGLHALLVLSVGHARIAAALVQRSGVSLAHRPRTAPRAGRVRRAARNRGRGARVGFERGSALPGAAAGAGETRRNLPRTNSSRASRATR